MVTKVNEPAEIVCDSYQGPNLFGSLPNEILFKILEYTDLRSFFNISLTCKYCSEACQQVANVKKTQFEVEKLYSTCCFFELPDTIGVKNNKCIIYRATSTNFLRIPKFKLLLCPDSQLYDSRITLDAQIDLLFKHSNSQQPDELTLVRQFIMNYHLQISPVELLWVIWRHLKSRIKLAETNEKKTSILQQYVNCMSFWIQSNFNGEWDGMHGRFFLINHKSIEAFDNEIYNTKFLNRELVRLNKKFYTFFPEGAERIESEWKKSGKLQEAIPEFLPATDSKTIFDFTVEQIVDPITTMNHLLCKNIYPHEFTAFGNEKLRMFACPNLQKLNDFRTKIVTAMVSLVTSSECIEMRMMILRKLLDCAVYSLSKAEIVDYFFIAMVYHHVWLAVYALRHTRALLLSDSEFNNQVERIDEIFTTDKSYSALRGHVHNQTGAHIHPLNFFLCDYICFTDAYDLQLPFVNKSAFNCYTSYLYDAYSRSLHLTSPLITKERKRELAASEIVPWLFSHQGDATEVNRARLLEPRNSEITELLYGELPHPIHTSYPLFAASFLPKPDAVDYPLQVSIFPTEIPWKKACVISSKISIYTCLTYWIEKFFQWEKMVMLDEHFREKCILPIQFRIIMLITNSYATIKKFNLTLQMYQEWKSTVATLIAFNWIALPK